MRKIGFLVVPLLAVASVQAHSYKCKQDNGKYLFSDIPCTTARQISEQTTIDYEGVIVKLSITPEAHPLPNRIANHFLTDISSACQKKDGPKLLSLFSEEAQEKLKFNIVNNNVFSAVSYVCKTVKSLRQDIAKLEGPVFFGSKKPYKSIELCVYTEDKGIENCLGNMKIIAEKGKLKLNVL